MIALLGAMASEVQALVGAMAVESSESSPAFEVWQGRLAGRPCVVARCGMGKVAAASSVQRLVDRWPISCLVVCGLAGSLSDSLRVGDVVVGDSFLQHDLDASPIFPRYHVPGLDLSIFRTQPELVRAAIESSRAFLAYGLAHSLEEEVRTRMGIVAPKVASGLIVTGDQFIQESRRAEIRRELPLALCVDMEGAAIAQVCLSNGTPFLVVRVISDGADAAAAVDFQRFVVDVAPAYTLGIVGELLPRLP